MVTLTCQFYACLEPDSIAYTMETQCRGTEQLESMRMNVSAHGLDGYLHERLGLCRFDCVAHVAKDGPEEACFGKNC
jgi:hypothetical protein